MTVKLTTQVIAACHRADRDGCFNDAWVIKTFGVTRAQVTAYMRLHLAVRGFGTRPLPLSKVKALLDYQKVEGTRLDEDTIAMVKEQFHV